MTSSFSFWKAAGASLKLRSVLSLPLCQTTIYHEKFVESAGLSLWPHYFIASSPPERPKSGMNRPNPGMGG